MQLWARLLLGVALSGAVGLLAYRRGSLSRSGVAGALIAGSCIFGFGGWVWGVLLILFFASSSLLSRYRAADKSAVAQQFAKGGRRDAWQALANGGVCAVLAIAYWLHEVPLLWGAFVGSMGAVTADTWATELGVLAKRRPRLVTTWQPVATGTSGGVSLLGMAATLAGSVSIGASATLLLAVSRTLGGNGPGGSGALSLILPAVLGGIVGAFVDSVMGATIQAVYYSEERQKETEKRSELDGTPNRYLRGWSWVTNDVVNLTSALVGALVGGLVFAGIG
ncbi:MAG TPA: DUF92 domain-containing protein [Anaerolineae bacterium]|nr:DUF92 domain-containing protein [Anaerolineae bacterium]